MYIKSIMFFGLLCCLTIEPAAARGGSPTVKTSSLVSKYLALAERMKDLERCMKRLALENERLNIENRELRARVIEHDKMIQEIGDMSARTIAMYDSMSKDVVKLDGIVQNPSHGLYLKMREMWIYLQGLDLKISREFESIESKIRALGDAVSLRSDMQLLEARLDEKIAILAFAQMKMRAEQADCSYSDDDSNCGAPSSRASTASCGSARSFGGDMKRCPTASCFLGDDDEHVVFSPLAAHPVEPTLSLKRVEPGYPSSF